MTNKIGKKRKITFWTRLGFGMGGMLNSGALTFTHSYMVLFLSTGLLEQVEEELGLIVDLGGYVKDVFVYHKAYGVLRADMDIRSRLDIEHFMEKIASGKSNLLMNVTSGYHYHTVLADSVQLLDIIQEKLDQKGFLAKLQDYEPVEF